MAGETEHWTWRMAPSGMSLFSAPAAAPAILDPADGGNPHNAIIAPPRGSTLTVRKMHGFICNARSMSDVTARMKVVLAIIASSGAPALGVIDLRTIWAFGMFQSTLGTPAADAIVSQGVAIEVDFDKSHRHASIHNGRGYRSFPEFGYAFVHTANGDDYNYLMDLTIDYDIVWDEESGTSKLIESEQEDWDQDGEI